MPRRISNKKRDEAVATAAMLDEEEAAALMLGDDDDSEHDDPDRSDLSQQPLSQENDSDYFSSDASSDEYNVKSANEKKRKKKEIAKAKKDTAETKGKRSSKLVGNKRKRRDEEEEEEEDDDGVEKDFPQYGSEAEEEGEGKGEDEEEEEEEEEDEGIAKLTSQYTPEQLAAALLSAQRATAKKRGDRSSNKRRKLSSQGEYENGGSSKEIADAIHSILSQDFHDKKNKKKKKKNKAKRGFEYDSEDEMVEEESDFVDGRRKPRVSVPIADLVKMRQSDAAKKLGIRPATLSRAWKQKFQGKRRWPWRTIIGIEDRLKSIQTTRDHLNDSLANCEVQETIEEIHLQIRSLDNEILELEREIKDLTVGFISVSSPVLIKRMEKKKRAKEEDL